MNAVPSDLEVLPSIVLVSPLPPPLGGIATWTKAVVDAVPRDLGVAIRLVNTAHREQRTDETTSLERLTTGALQWWRVMHGVRKAFRHGPRPVCVHVNSSGSLGLVRDIAVLALARAHKTRAVLHLRFGRTPSLLAVRNWETWLLLTAVRFAEIVIAIDRPTFHVLEERAPSKVTYIPNFIRPSLHSAPESVESPTVIYLGSVSHSKGVEDLVAAWELASLSGWRLEIVGPQAASFDAAWERTLPSSIEVLGPLAHDEAMARLSAASVFVLPSHTEGFPNVVLEAMQAGTPVVATSVGAIPEMLQGGAGIVVRPHAVDELAEALRLVTSNADLRTHLSDAAVRRVRAAYAPAVVFAQYRNVWTRNGPPFP